MREQDMCPGVECSVYTAIVLSLFCGLVVAANGGIVLGLGAVFFIILSIGSGRVVAALFKVRLVIELQLLTGAVLIAYGLALPPYVAGISILIPATVLLAGLSGYLVRPAGQCDNTIGLAPWTLSLVAVAGFSLIWSLDSSARYAFLEQDKLRMWVDLFIHAGTIGEFGDPRMVGRGLSGLVDAKPTFYHFVSYALPGLAVRLTGISPADIIPAFWIPIGIFMTTLGLFALGRSLAGPASGALAVLLLALVPDAAAYGLRQGFFSFHWMMETSPGTLYALPAALAAIAVLVDWSRKREHGQLALASLLLFSTFMLRAHIFIWLVVPFAVVILICLPNPVRRYRWALLVIGTVALPSLLLWIARAETAALGYRAFMLRFIEAVHLGMAPTSYDGLYLSLMQTLGPMKSLPIGLALALAGMAGIWLLTFFAGCAAAAWGRKLEEADALALAILPGACIMMTFAPTPFHGDYSDFRQRAFVLVFVLMLVWTARFATLFLPRLLRPLPVALGACLALGSTLVWMPYAKPSRIGWAKAFDYIDMTPGAVETGRWIGREGRRGDSIAFANSPHEERLFDVPTILMGVSGVPAYLSRIGLYRLSGPPRSDIVKARVAELAAIHGLTDATEARRRLQQDGVGFYVTVRTDMPAWDQTGQTAAFRAGDLIVWRENVPASPQ